MLPLPWNLCLRAENALGVAAKSSVRDCNCNTAVGKGKRKAKSNNQQEQNWKRRSQNQLETFGFTVWLFSYSTGMEGRMIGGVEVQIQATDINNWLSQGTLTCKGLSARTNIHQMMRVPLQTQPIPKHHWPFRSISSKSLLKINPV